MIPSPHQRPDLYAVMQDSSLLYLVTEWGDTTHADLASSAYTYTMSYDSISQTSYMLTEWRRNRTLLRLPQWKDRRMVNARASLLSYNSTTESFICSAGDTLSFYRELEWRNPMTSLQDTNNYFALDSLDFTVELVRTSDSARIALIDSIGILPNAQPDRPRIHGMRPLMALVKYIVPPELNGTQAFMRMLLYHRGTGKYWFTRHDEVTSDLSMRLQDSSWTWYLEMFGQGSLLYKTQVLETLKDRAPDRPALNVRFAAGQPAHATITAAAAPDGGPLAIGVYDINGRALFYPLSTPGVSGTVRAEYTFGTPGEYFVGLLHNGGLVATRKVSVAR